MTSIMAVLNVSPESFYSESIKTDRGELLTIVSQAIREGAQIIDVGAMATAPYKEASVSADEEARRVAQLLPHICGASTVPVSIDTQRALVAEMAVELGASIINDISGLALEPDLARVARDTKSRLVLTANEMAGVSESDPVNTVISTLRHCVDVALKAGLNSDQIILDPGLGFFRNRGIHHAEWDMKVLRDIRHIKSIGLPVLVGASRKSFIGSVLDRAEPRDRLAGSLAVAAWCAENDVDWLRVHDVAATRDVLTIWERLRLDQSPL